MFALGSSWRLKRWFLSRSLNVRGFGRINDKRSVITKFWSRVCGRFLSSSAGIDTFVDVKPEITTSFNITGLDVEYFWCYITGKNNFLCLLLNLVVHIHSFFRFLHNHLCSCHPFTWCLRLSALFFVKKLLIISYAPLSYTLVARVHAYVYRLIRWFDYNIFGLWILSRSVRFFFIFVHHSLHRWDLRNQGL